jgi:hypothetical protein
MITAATSQSGEHARAKTPAPIVIPTETNTLFVTAFEKLSSEALAVNSNSESATVTELPS